ncbi:hypothetical protein P4056_25970 [Pseudomonas aeruginosa]|nr:hypothetical protein [Pseudomonas aeruginosa]
MSSLTVYHENQPEQPLKLLTHAEDIASTLAEVGVRFERWKPPRRSPPAPARTR